MEGGAGYSPQQISGMTPDQIVFRLTSLENLPGPSKIVKQDIGTASILRDENGLIRGVDAEGNPIKARIVGKSLASIMREKADKKKEDALSKEKKRKRRRKARRGGTT